MAQPKVEIVMGGTAQAAARKPREPKERFALEIKPWSIEPAFIHPVLAGETLTNAMLMSRVVTDPVKSPIAGWWVEYYLHYVKHTQLADWTKDLHLDPAFDASTYRTAADAKYFHNGGINWTKMASDLVVEWYFRKEEEAVTIATVGGMPSAIASMNEGWWQSLRFEDAAADGADDELPGVNPVIPDNVPAGFGPAYSQWENMRALGLTNDATFEDYLRSQGVRIPKNEDEELRKPELIRYHREFQYPSNTIDPATGIPTSAVSWSVAMRADKDRYFTEPGFIICHQIVRPKVFMGNLAGSITAFMDRPYDWMPAALRTESYASVKEYVQGQPGPFGIDMTGTDDLWYDMKDLFLYGSEYKKIVTAPHNAIALPTADANHRYPTDAMAESLFVDNARFYVRADGICELTIKSLIGPDST